MSIVTGILFVICMWSLVLTALFDNTRNMLLRRCVGYTFVISLALVILSCGHWLGVLLSKL